MTQKDTKTEDFAANGKVQDTHAWGELKAALEDFRATWETWLMQQEQEIQL